MRMHGLVLFRACGDRVIIDNDGHAGPARIAGDAGGGNACFFDQLAQGALGPEPGSPGSRWPPGQSHI